MGSLLDEQEFAPFLTQMRYRYQNKLVRCNARLHLFFTALLWATDESAGYQLLWSAFWQSQPRVDTWPPQPLDLVDSSVRTSKPIDWKFASWVTPSYRLGWHCDSYPNTSFVLLGLPHSLAFSVDVEKLRRRSINFFSSVRISERSTSSPSIEHCEGLSQIVIHSLLVLRETVWFDRSSRYVMVSPVVCGYPP